jgi:hypothetical protein
LRGTSIAVLVFAIGCTSSQTADRHRVAPQDLAGTWTYAFPDPQNLGGTIYIPNDTSPQASAEISSSTWSGMIEYPGALHALVHRSRYVCWRDTTMQSSGIELTVHSGQLLATYFDSCTRLARRSDPASQRSVRDCRHTVLNLRRVAPPD